MVKEHVTKPYLLLVLEENGCVEVWHILDATLDHQVLLASVTKCTQRHDPLGGALVEASPSTPTAPGVAA